MEPADARRRFAAARFARLATVRPDGSPHIVPVVFAVDGDVVWTAVDDAKPKRSPRLQRLANLRAEPRCALLVDHEDDDWTRLWWVRADGVAEILDAAAHPALALLTARYPQYREAPPPGPLVAVHVQRWSGWSAVT